MTTTGDKPPALLLGLDARNGKDTSSLTTDSIILIVGFSDETAIQEGLSTMRERIKDLLLEYAWLAQPGPLARFATEVDGGIPGCPGPWQRARPAMTRRLSAAPRRVLKSGCRDLRLRAAIAGALLLGFAGAIHASPESPYGVLAQVPVDRRAEVEDIIAAPTFVRTLHLETFANLQVLTYLLDHPDVNATLARALGIAPYRAVRISPGRYEADDGGGNTGTIEIFGTEGAQRVLMERGVSPGWWFGDISGRVVALVAFSAEGKRLRGDVTVWARIDQGVIASLLRLLAPMLGGFLDGKLREQFGLTIRVAEDAVHGTDRFCQRLAGISDGSLEQRQTLAGMAACPEEVGPRILRVPAPAVRPLAETRVDYSLR